MQKYTSANTRLNQIPCVHKYIDYDSVDTILDYGCGKYTKFKEFIESKGIEYHGYDPYHKTAKENTVALSCTPDLIVCCNVLNVIGSDIGIEALLRQIASFECPVIFSIYEGNGTGVGKVTKKDCYQRNMKAKCYVPIISLFFGEVSRKGNVIFAK